MHPLLLPGIFAIIVFLSAAPDGRGSEIPIDISKAPLIYKNDTTEASAESAANGEGIRLDYDFSNGGDTLRCEFTLITPLDGPVSSLKVTGKGTEGPAFVLVRDVNKQSIAYKIDPFTENEQVFTVDLSSPAFPGAKKTTLEYPITAIGFTMKKPAELKGFFEISKITAERED